MAKEAGSAGAGVAATGGLTSVIVGQSWLVPVLQVAVSIVFIVMAIDKRMGNLHKAVNQTRGEVEVLEGKVNMLACQRPAKRIIESCDES